MTEAELKEKYEFAVKVLRLIAKGITPGGTPLNRADLVAEAGMALLQLDEDIE